MVAVAVVIWVAAVIWAAVIWAAVAAEDATDASSLELASAVLAVAAVAVPAGYGHREAGSTAAGLSLYPHLVSPSKWNTLRRLLRLLKTGVAAGPV